MSYLKGCINKAQSDFWCKTKFSFRFASEYKAIWKENLAIYQKSLRAFSKHPFICLLGLVDFDPLYQFLLFFGLLVADKKNLLFGTFKVKCYYNV